MVDRLQCAAWLIVGAWLAASIANTTLAAEPPKLDKHAAEAFFETKVRPLLAEHCYKCHGPDRHKANLRLDSLHGLLTGGDSGPALVPGDAEHSLLLQAVRYGDDFVQMPPTRKLPDKLIADLTQWVKLGAPWPGADPAEARAAESKPKRPQVEITEEDRNYWFFRPIKRPPTPQVAAKGWTRSPLDAFIAQRLEAKQVAAVAEADKRTLIRRVYFDLIGLPPAPEKVAAFVADRSPDAYDRLLDELLARPEYGERWGRHWLDVVRFAQTNGYERDGEKPYAWRYRDYVIQAFNDDKPYDRFVVEQLAGDELPEVTNESLIATGFYRLGLWDDEPDDARQAEFDGLDDVVVTTSAAFMGVTMGCCRCHDHVFDPLPQTDYYQFLSFFRNIRTYQNANFSGDSATYLALANPQHADRWFAERKTAAKPLEEKLKTIKNPKERRKLEDEIKKTLAAAPPFEWALGVRERDGKPPATHLLIRGNAGTPAAEVTPAFLAVLGGETPSIDSPPATAHSSGRRLALARWLTRSDNPLLARVMVNRIWQHHFGRGIVKTTSDFGQGGIPPTHPELLDWLAAEFMEHGWSIKHMHRAIMRSATYRLSSRADDKAGLAADPDNDLYWHQNLRRLEAEAIRDTVLNVAGDLNTERGGRGFFPHLAGEVLAGASKPGLGWEITPVAEQQRRSVYAFVKRSMLPPMLELFDYSNTAQPLGERQVTTVAPQSLLLLNDDFMQEQAAAFADRLVREVGHDSLACVRRAYELAFDRSPTAKEMQLALDYQRRQASAFAAVEERLTFRTDVPDSLHEGYLRRLQPTDYVQGPTAGWTYYPGLWKGGYEGIKSVDAQRGPFALWAGPTVRDGTLEGRVMLHNASELGSLIFRATAEGDVFRGYEVLFDPREQTISLRRHGADVVLLAEAEAKVPTSVLLPIKIEFAGPRVRVWLNGQTPLLDITDPQPLGDAGRLGARTWGAALSLDQMHVRSGDTELNLARTPLEPLDADTDRPLAGWQYFGGRWATTADGGYAVKPEPGAKIVWNTPAWADGVVEAEVRLDSAGGDAGLLLRVNQPTDGVDSLVAYNINLKPNLLRLGKHENNWRAIATAPLKLELGKWNKLRVQLDAGRIRITIGDATKPQIDFVDASPLAPGRVGFRTFNAQSALRKLSVTSGSQHWQADFAALVPRPPRTKVADGQPRSDPERRALESFCLLIFNLNELIYVD